MRKPGLFTASIGMLLLVLTSTSAFAGSDNGSVVAASEATSLVSIAMDGAVGNSRSFQASISSDGRYIAFASVATNLVPGDTNDHADVFLRDLATQQTSRISLAFDGSEPDHQALWPSISGDGRYVAFQSHASNLIAHDENFTTDVFVHDRETEKTTRVSIATGGTEADKESAYPSISADGRYVVFASQATNLVPEDTNEKTDIFVHDRETRETSRVSVATDGTEGNDISLYPSISGHGRYVAFSSRASTLVAACGDGNAWDIFMHDRMTSETRCIAGDPDFDPENGSSISASVSADGRYVAFLSSYATLVPQDTNEFRDIFVYEITSGKISRASVASDGTESNNHSSQPSISADGRYVAFTSNATNLVSGDTNADADIFVHDRTTGQTTRVSLGAGNTEGNDTSYEPSISGNGRYVAFESEADNFFAQDTNGFSDIFIRDRYFDYTRTYLPLTVAP